MRIIKYTVELDDNKQSILVKEDAKNCTFLNKLDSPENIVDMLNYIFKAKYKSEEHLWLIALDAKCNPIGVFEVSHGTANSSLSSPREVFVRLCLVGAVNFVLAHNHPSGDTTPSKDDIEVTSQMKRCGNMMNIRLLDHIIIGNNYYSFKMDGMLSV